MRVLITGSRDWTDYDTIANRLSALPGEHEEIEIIHGGARGADTFGARAAKDLGFTVMPPYRPRYEHFRGKEWAAPLARNIEMLDKGKPDLVLAFQRNGSSGTQHTIDEARKRDVPVEVIPCR